MEDVVPAELQKKQFDWLGIETGANEISNIDVNLNYTEHIDSWKEQIYSAAETVFDIAQWALDNYPNLRKVILMKRIQRYDNNIRSELTKYGNFVYEKLWTERGCPANIVIGEHNLECFGNLRELRYGKPGTQVCDNAVSYTHLTLPTKA